MAESIDELCIRAACNGDLPAIRRIVFSVLREYGLEPHPAGTDADLEDLEASYFRGGGAFDVAQQSDGRIVGTAGLCRISSHQAELRKMYLLPEVRGRGLGKRLLERMLDHARLTGCREVVLETNSVLKEAVALYRKYGFLPAEKDDKSPRCDQALLLRF